VRDGVPNQQNIPPTVLQIGLPLAMGFQPPFFALRGIGRWIIAAVRAVGRSRLSRMDLSDALRRQTQSRDQNQVTVRYWGFHVNLLIVRCLQI